MTEINSPLGRRAFATSSTKVFNVPDESQPAPEPVAKQTLEEFQQIRRESINMQKKISPIAKERIEILTGLGRLHDDVEFDGVVFSLQSLKAGEMQQVVRLTMEAQSGTDSYFIGRNQVLARAIYKIDGQDVALQLGNATFEARIQWIEDMEDSLVEYLHGKYLAMVQKNKSKFAVETEEQMREVVEDVKKS